MAQVPSPLRGGAARVHRPAAGWTVPKFDQTVPARTRAASPRLLDPAGLERRHRTPRAAGRARRAAGGPRVVSSRDVPDPRAPSSPRSPSKAGWRVTARFVPGRRAEMFAAGAARVSTDQPLGDLLMLLLEPASPDSYFAWGFFHEVLQNTEYVEAYVMEPMAERMLAEDPGLRAEFERSSAAAERRPGAGRRSRSASTRPSSRVLPRACSGSTSSTRYFDDRAFLYPVAREGP